MLGQSFYAVQVQRYGARTECGKILRRNIIRMLHEVQFGCIQIQPVGYLPAGYKMDLVHPRGKLLDTPEPIAQVFPIPIAFYSNVIQTMILRQISIKIFLPLRIIAIHPCHYKIYFFHAPFTISIYSINNTWSLVFA